MTPQYGDPFNMSVLELRAVLRMHGFSQDAWMEEDNLFLNLFR